jgi:proline dehydrogenase
VRGSEPLPEGLKGTALLTAMENFIITNRDNSEAADIAYELANSPLATGLSEAAQELRLARERMSLSPSSIVQDIRRERAKKVVNYEEKKAAMKKELKKETRQVLLPKEELQWDSFLNSIIC